MEQEESAELAKWPFFLGYLSLLAVAISIIVFAPKPYSIPAMSGVIISGLTGPVFLLLPFLIEYFSRLKQERNQLRAAADEQFGNSLRIVAELTELQQVFTRQAKQGAANFTKLDELVPQLEKHSDHLSRLAEKFDQAAKSETKGEMQAKLEGVAKDMAGFLNELKELPDRLEKRIGELETAAPQPEAGLERLTKMVEELAETLRSQGETLDAAPKPVPEVKIKKKTAKKKSAPQPDLLDLDFDEDFDPDKQEPVRRSLEEAEEVSLIVNLHLSIGNIPYVRGEGAGLSWEKGAEMQFLEIGKWEWRATEVGETVVTKIFLNDNLSSFGEDIEIEAGEQVEIFPEFPES